MAMLQSGETYKYEAFISYRHKDPDMSVATALHRQLERFSIPPSIRKTHGIKKLRNVFRDQEELPTSTDLGRDIEAALTFSKWLIVVASPRLLESEWCLREVDFFLEMGRRDSILILLAEGEPEESFPLQLRFVDVDGQPVEVEPLAADVRADSIGAMIKKLRREKLRLLAPMLGVSYDDLFQRAKKYARRRALMLGAAALAVMIVFSGVVGNQMAKTANANRQAEEANRIAEEADRQAEEANRIAEEAARQAEEANRMAEEADRQAKEADRLTEEANRLTALEQVMVLVNQSDRQRTDGMRQASIQSAKEAMALAAQYGLDAATPAAALYNAQIMFPIENTFARLTLPGKVSQVVFSEDSTLLAAVSDKTTITVWDIQKDREVWSETLPDGFRVADPDDCQQSIVFTSNNELIVFADKASRGIFKYASDGALIFSKIISALFGTNLFLVWEEAGVIAITTIASSSDYIRTHGDDNSDNRNFVRFYDMYTGDVMSASQLYDDSNKLELSNDKKTMCAFSDGPENPDFYENKILLQVFHTDGSNPPVKGARLEMQKSLCSYTYLNDNTVAAIIGGKGLYVFDIEDGSGYCLLDVSEAAGDYFEDDELRDFFARYLSSTTQIIKGFDKGEFLWEVNSSELYRYGFDEEQGRIVYIDTVVNITSTGYSFSFADWAEKDEKTVFYRLTTGGSSSFRVEDEYSRYHDFAIVFPTNGFQCVSSRNGIVAMFSEQANICYLYNGSIEPNDFRVKLDNGRYQVAPPHFDFASGFCITEWRDEGGLYFEIYQMESDRFTNPKRAYLPDTEGYRLSTADRKPYRSVEYGKDYAVIIKEGETGGYEVYTLEYKTAEIKFLTGHLLRFGSKAMSKNYLVLNRANDDSFTMYDRHTGEHYSFQQMGYDISPYSYQRIDGGPYHSDIFFGFVKTRADDTYRAISYDYKGNRVISETDTKLPLSVFWSENGNRLFHVFADKTVAYETETMTVIGEIYNGLLSGKALGDGLMALTTISNTVLLYDMESLEQKGEIKPTGATVNSVNYNSVNKLCVVTTESTACVYDTANNRPYCGELKFPVAFQSTDHVNVYVSNDKTRLVFAVSTDEWLLYDEFTPHYMYYFEYYSYPLFTADTILGSLS